jgi:O-antigen/teichoic acid export membrane protein
LSNIRITHSGLISFLVGIGSIVSGAIFTLIITRQLSVEEFGTWSLIGSVIAYTLLMESTINYWITRETARNVPSAKTGITTSGIFSVIAMLAYVIISIIIGKQSNADFTMMAFAVILVPVYFLDHTLRGISQGWKPNIDSYSFIGVEISKIPIGLFLIYFLDLGLSGLIITMVISNIVSIIIQLSFNKEKLKGKFQLKYIKKWMKLSWIVLYKDIPSTLYISDTLIFLTITGNVTGLAYIAAARAISTIVKHSQRISIAIYPTLLSGGRQEHLQENLMKVFYFSFPTIAFAITFAKPGLFALNPEYLIAASVVGILAFREFIAIINRIFRTALQAIEKVDVQESPTFKEYIKSNLILVPTVRMIQYGSYAILLIVGLYVLVNEGFSQIILVEYWAYASLIVEIPFFIYFFIIINRDFTLNFDYKAILKYGIACLIAFGPTYILMENYLVYEISVFDFIPNLIPYIFLSLCSYLIITFMIDYKTRKLMKSITNELRNFKK